MKNKKTTMKMLNMVEKMVKTRPPEDCTNKPEWYAGREAMIDVVVDTLRVMVQTEEEEF